MNNNKEKVLESLVRVLSLYSICIGLHVSKQELLFQAINLHVANRSAVQVKCKSRLKF